jgi:Ca-activated chloride channel family protein
MALIMTGWEEIFLKYINWLNKGVLILFLLFASMRTSAQFYLRGEVRDEKDNLLPNAKIILQSTPYVYSSGGSGSFGIMTSKKIDSIIVSSNGYQTLSLIADASKYLVIKLNLMYSNASLQKNRLMSFTKDLKLTDRENWIASGESYSSLLENEFVNAKKYPETGFAIRIDKASYSNVRRFVNMQTKVPPDAVRIEELMNYFNFGYTKPRGDSIFSFTSYISDCPWNASSQLLFLNICARKIEPEKIPPSNLVFLIDVSGSMDMPNRLPLLKSAFKLLVDNLRDKDTISIVVYGSTVGVWMGPSSGKEKIKIRKAIEDLNPGGATPGQSGILSAYSLAKSQYIKNGNNRVILATDGDFNVGQSTEEQLEKMIISHQESGIYLTCLGVGMGNYKDSKLEVLAKKGKGNFAYLDNEAEAEKVLVKELTQTLYSVADNASLGINFNSNYVKEYRLIGYDNKLKALADSVMEVEGGEVGSGHSMMVLFEIVPNDFISDKNDVAMVSTNYHLPKDTTMKSTSFRVPYNYKEFPELPPYLRFATSIAMFGTLLKESVYAKKMSWNETIILANESYDQSDPIQKEFITIIEKAKKIYLRRKKRRASAR